MIDAARAGDEGAYAALIRRYSDLAFRAAYLVTRNSADAEDACQEAFAKAYRALLRFRVGAPFRPWLLRIVTNAALNSARSSKRRSAATERLARDAERDEHEPPDAAVEAAEQSSRVWAAVADLPGDDQRLIYLRYFLETSEAEAAESIGRPVGTVKSRLHRALKRLRGVIEDGYPDLLPISAQLLREEKHESAANT